jgi:rhodanese-related sulfurtransferase
MDEEIAPERVQELRDAGADLRIVDIRSRREFERGHIPGSECIPFHELPRQVSALDGASRVVTVCPHGESSIQAARLIRSYEGIADDARVKSMAGGLEAWEYDLDTADDATPDSPL